MGFKRLDDSTVVDDEGNKYFMPGLPGDDKSDTAPQPVKDPKDTELEGLLSYLNKAPEDTIEMPEDNVNVPQAPTVDDKEGIAPLAAEAAHEAAVPVPPTPQQQRDAAIKGDLSGFAAKGGTLDTDQEAAEAQGGIADEQAQAALVKAQGAEDVNKAMNEAAVARSKAANAAANALVGDAQKHYQEAEDKTAAWEKEVKEASKAIVDPNRAFTTMGGFGKAMWALQFIGAGMQGGQQVTATWGVLQKVLQDDIEAQRSTNANRREGLASEGQALRERIANTKELDAVNAKAMGLRLDALGKELDARIKAIGQDAARKAGILDAKVAIDQGTQKLLMKVREDNLKVAEAKTKQSFEDHNIRLKGNIDAINKQAEIKQTKDLDLRNDLITEPLKAGLKKGETEGDLPTGTGLGLALTDKATNQPVAGKLKISDKTKRIEAAKILSDANQEASLLKEIEGDIGSMSNADLLRGGTPQLASKINDVIQARAVKDNGHRLSDDDVIRAAKEEFGVPLSNDGSVWRMVASVKQPGNLKDNIVKTIATKRANLSTETTNKILPYVDSEDQQKYNIQYNPQDVRVAPASNTQTDINTMIERAGEGSKVRKIDKSPAEPAAAKGETITQNEVDAFEAMKAIGRGEKGGLKILPKHDEDMVSRFESNVKELHERGEDTEANITALQDAYLNNQKIGDQAKRRVSIEAFEALQKYKEREEAKTINSKPGQKYIRSH